LISFVKISLILSLKAEIAFGVFCGFFSFKVLTSDFFASFLVVVFFVFFSILGLEFLTDFTIEVTPHSQFLSLVHNFEYCNFFLTIFFSIFQK
jgi:hypothetical protein